MEKMNKFLLMVIAMMAIMITAVGIDRGLQLYNSKQWEKERVERYRQSYADVADMQMKISQLSENPEALEAFLEENRAYFDEVLDTEFYSFSEEYGFGEEAQETATFGEGPEHAPTDETGNGAEPGEGDLSDSGMEGDSEDPESVSDNDVEDTDPESISGNDVNGEDYESVSANDMVHTDRESVSGNETEDVSGNMPGGAFVNTQGDVSENRAVRWGWTTVSGNSLLEKRKIRGSYMETQRQKKIDSQIIANNEVDFSEVSIACLGDSITEATNLDSMEDYRQYAYPTRLKEILGAESVTNLGIGGSSIGRYWDKAFVERYKEIPEDTDLIIVMGGTNDGFCLNQEELGTMEERAENTFIGDLDELMRGLKENYPDAEIVFTTPLPNVLHDILRKERDYLLPQVAIVNAIKSLAREYEIPVIDLYNSNILDTHDAAVIYNYMPDGVHCNPEGYSLLAEHFAAELIKLYAEQEGIEVPAYEDENMLGQEQENKEADQWNIPGVIMDENYEPDEEESDENEGNEDSDL